MGSIAATASAARMMHTRGDACTSRAPPPSAHRQIIVDFIGIFRMIRSGFGGRLVGLVRVNARASIVFGGWSHGSGLHARQGRIDLVQIINHLPSDAVERNPARIGATPGRQRAHWDAGMLRSRLGVCPAAELRKDRQWRHDCLSGLCGVCHGSPSFSHIAEDKY